MQNNKLNQYRKTSIETASPGELILMLYSGAIRFMHNAKKAIVEQDIEGANKHIIRAENIVSELMSTLDMDAGGEVAKNLFKLYEYFHWQLVQANIKKDVAILDDVIRQISQMKETWTMVVAKAKLAGKVRKPVARAAKANPAATMQKTPPAKILNATYTNNVAAANKTLAQRDLGATPAAGQSPKPTPPASSKGQRIDAYHNSSQVIPSAAEAAKSDATKSPGVNIAV